MSRQKAKVEPASRASKPVAKAVKKSAERSSSNVAKIGSHKSASPKLVETPKSGGTPKAAAIPKAGAAKDGGRAAPGGKPAAVTSRGAGKAATGDAAKAGHRTTVASRKPDKTASQTRNETRTTTLAVANQISAIRTAAKAAVKSGTAAAAVRTPTTSLPARTTSRGTTVTSSANPRSGKGPAKSGERAKPAETVLPPDYRPSETEPFMNGMHRLYFRQKLLAWKEDIIRQTRETLAGLHEESAQHADLADRATSETDRALELRARDRQRKLVSKIDAALSRLEDGTYGYCEETGEPIGLKRLDARPIATLSLEAQERHERREKVYRED